LDKLITQALETSLRAIVFERWDEIPAMRMLQMTADEIKRRAERLCSEVPRLEIIPGESVAGGGSTPDETLPTWLLVIPGEAVELERKLRASDPPVIARIEKDRLVLDLRTVFEEETPELQKILSCLLS